jgi:hypothetical protein
MLPGLRYRRQHAARRYASLITPSLHHVRGSFRRALSKGTWLAARRAA